MSFLHPLPLNSTPHDHCVRVCENTAFSLHSDDAGTDWTEKTGKIRQRAARLLKLKIALNLKSRSP